jgi:UPF0755 protein
LRQVKKIKRRRKVGIFAIKSALWTVLSLIIIAVVYVGFFQGPPPVKSVDVVVKSGLNTAQIADILAAKGVISNAYTFRVYAAFTQTESRLQPGKYKFRTDMTYDEILKQLTKVEKKHYVQIIIPEGFTATQIAKRLAEKTGRPEADFLEYIRGQGLEQVRPSALPSDVGTAEGYLFPKTYDFDKKEHPRKIVAALIAQYKEETVGLNWSFARQKNLTVHQIMTIASLVEREARVPEERSMMAAVIYNRLDKGMPLQIDATVQYALPERKEFLTNDDLKIASPYNTYQHTGLPPGPIANPGLLSIKAALAPAKVDYLYYVLTSEDGRHTFTNNYDEFLAAKKNMPGPH